MWNWKSSGTDVEHRWRRRERMNNHKIFGIETFLTQKYGMELHAHYVAESRM